MQGGIPRHLYCGLGRQTPQLTLSLFSFPCESPPSTQPCVFSHLLTLLTAQSYFAAKECSRLLSSPLSKRAGPKGLRAESARSVTGRRCPHSGEGEEFLSLQPDFFNENCCNSGTESRKIVPRWEMNRHTNGRYFGPQKNTHTSST